MTLHLRAAVRDGLVLLGSRNGLVLVAAIVAAELFALLVTVGTATQVLPLGDNGLVVEEPLPGTGESPPAAVEAIGGLLGGVVGSLVTIPGGIVAIRTFLIGERDRFPDPVLFHRLGRATLSVLLAGVVLTIAYVVLFVVPFVVTVPAVLAIGGFELFGPTGSFAIGVGLLGLSVTVAVLLTAFLWLSMVFVTQEIAIKDAGVVDALRGSWRATSGNRLRLLVLVGALVVVQLAVTLPASVPDSWGILALSLPVSGLLAALWYAVLTRAYLDIHGEEAPVLVDRFRG